MGPSNYSSSTGETHHPSERIDHYDHLLGDISIEVIEVNSSQGVADKVMKMIIKHRARKVGGFN